MRLSVGLPTRSGLALLVLAGCRHQTPPPPESSAQPAAADAAAVAAAPRPVHVTHRATFDLASARFAIEDVHMSTRFDQVLARSSARLVVNGGFFAPDGGPVGLAISEGKTLGRFSPDMSGGVLWIRGSTAHLSATEEYQPVPADFAIQCRPRLVVGSRVNIRSDDGRHAPRTALCLRDAGRTIDVVAATGDDDPPGPTLFELATELAALGCEEALNLDGGPSTGWASRDDAGVSFVAPRAPVRHVVVVRDDAARDL